jgi:hypothetical protein
MYPYERSLVKRLEDEPFVMLGVSGDAIPLILSKAIEKNSFTWPIIFDGGSKAGFPITREWQATVSPTIYLIDHEGVIRFKHIGIMREGELNRKINRLLNEIG